MSGTTSGGKNAAITNIERYGADFYKKIGAKGGKKQVAKGFSMMTPEQRSAASRKGGSVRGYGK